MLQLLLPSILLNFLASFLSINLYRLPAAPKAASQDVHGDAFLDSQYATSGYKFKSRINSGWDGASVATTVDVNDNGDVRTPATMKFQFPKPLGTDKVHVDSLQLGKDGQLSMTISANEDLLQVDNLKVVAKADLKDLEKSRVGVTYTGIKDTSISLETSPTEPKDFNLKVSHKMGKATAGVSLGEANMQKPDFDLVYSDGKYIGSLALADQLTTLCGRGSYKVNDDLDLGAKYEYKHEGEDTWTLGAKYKIDPMTSLKAKVQQDKTISASIDHQLAKGLEFEAGAKYDIRSDDSKSAVTYGLQVNLDA